jgi:hypothetical protein
MATEHGDLLQADLGDGEPTTHSEGRQLGGVPRARTIRPHPGDPGARRRPPASPFGRASQRGEVSWIFFVSFFKIFFLNLFALKVIEKTFVKKTFVFSEFFKTFEKHF